MSSDKASSKVIEEYQLNIVHRAYKALGIYEASKQDRSLLDDLLSEIARVDHSEVIVYETFREQASINGFVESLTRRMIELGYYPITEGHEVREGKGSISELVDGTKVGTFTSPMIEFHLVLKSTEEMVKLGFEPEMYGEKILKRFQK